ncbi:hypothetical protein FHS95_002473 [Sphingomonas naasensis]|uniref:Uncharacterized protein n=1 Tax=Sphingomonas naasensis TaxID=1344951 RepID=A0A4S1WMK1_9SPHN|nr:hypothetical protein [Sphingomonas naasensis]NIJ20781.1 hypothetical protein [Sphingomonas naasensis]TGX43187.1 hypothetical protein E5A74_08415 [Sphingomonas naasensis]
MNDAGLAMFWAFSRCDLAGPEFDRWFSSQPGLEAQLGADLYLDLLCGNYADREALWRLRRSLDPLLTPLRQCECPTLRDLAATPMGGDFHFEKIFESFERIVDFGPEKWWLHLSRCSRCATFWLIAQDERIYDEFFLHRIDETVASEARAGRWPRRFFTYEDVLATGRALSNPPRFLDPMAGSLQWTVEDLLGERPDITVEEIAHLLGLSAEHAAALLRRVRAARLK